MTDTDLRCVDVDSLGPVRQLPDVMHYDRGRPAHYPNGRVLTDDVYEMRMAFLTHGRVTSDGVGLHDDYLPEFPFVGIANEQAPGGPTTLLASDISA